MKLFDYATWDRYEPKEWVGEDKASPEEGRG